MAYVPLYPMRLRPALHTKVWGGRRLESLLHIPLPDDQNYGEAWIMHDTATVDNGVLRGMTVGEVLHNYGQELIGAGAVGGSKPEDGMPLLAKFLDAFEWLSLQVHPNDAQARELENQPRGKTEAWYVIATEPGSKLGIGIQPGYSREDVAAAIAENRLEAIMVYAEVEPGDVLFIEPGTIHALGPGILIYEIQQSSDITYRLYDYGRPRPLHVEKGLTVARTDYIPEIKHTGNDHTEVVEIVNSDFFVTRLHHLRVGDYMRGDTRKVRFHILSCIDGEAVVEWGTRSQSIGNAMSVQSGETVDMALGQSVLIPASVGEFRVRGRGKVLQSFQP